MHTKQTFFFKEIDFDIQLFAEGEAGAEGGEQTEPPATKQEESAGTLAGEAGKQELQNSPEGGEKKPEDSETEPKLPEKYDLAESLPEGAELDQEQFDKFSAVAKECGLNNEQANKVAKYGFEFAKMNIEAVQAAREQEVQDWGTQTKQQLGTEMTKTIEKVGIAVDALEKKIPGIRTALNETGAGNRIELVQAFALLGEIVGEDTFRGFGGAAKQTSVYDSTNFKKYE